MHAPSRDLSPIEFLLLNNNTTSGSIFRVPGIPQLSALHSEVPLRPGNCTSAAVSFNLCTREWEMWKESKWPITSNNEDWAWAIAAIERSIFGNLRGSLLPRFLKQWELTSPLTTSRFNLNLRQRGTREMLSLSGYARVCMINFRVQVVMHACYFGKTRQPTFLYTSSRALTFR